MQKSRLTVPLSWVRLFQDTVLACMHAFTHENRRKRVQQKFPKSRRYTLVDMKNVGTEKKLFLVLFSVRIHLLFSNTYKRRPRMYVYIFPQFIWLDTNDITFDVEVDPLQSISQLSGLQISALYILCIWVRSWTI